MEKRKLKIGDVVQINPEKGHRFPGFLVVVTEPKSYGAQGYLMHWCDFPAIRFKDRAFVNVKYDQIEYVGHVFWHGIPKEEENE